jgi:hypothetical protein
MVETRNQEVRTPVLEDKLLAQVGRVDLRDRFFAGVFGCLRDWIGYGAAAG